MTPGYGIIVKFRHLRYIRHGICGQLHYTEYSTYPFIYYAYKPHDTRSMVVTSKTAVFSTSKEPLITLAKTITIDSFDPELFVEDVDVAYEYAGYSIVKLYKASNSLARLVLGLQKAYGRSQLLDDFHIYR